MYRAAVIAAVVLVPSLAEADLLDRTHFDYFHMVATTELGNRPHHDAATVTLHVQASTECPCHFSFYGTLPVSIDLREARPVIAAGGTIAPDSRTAFGTADVGVFGGTQTGGVTTLFRVGGLLPTGANEPHAWLPSARAGDRVLELPRSAGVRLSTTRMWDRRAKQWRVDAGIDVAEAFAAPGKPVHVIPRVGAGVVVSSDADFTFAIESALSLDPFVDGADNVRWGTGITSHYTGWTYVQPAVTLAAVRAEDGWGASVLVDLLASSKVSASNAE